MNQENRRPTQIIKDWWGVVVIFIAILGGFFWLDENYARIEKLAMEKCNLSYEIRITKAEIEFKSADEEKDLHQGEYEDLLQQADPPEELVKFKKSIIIELDKRVKVISGRKNCLTKAKELCIQKDASTEKCYD